jgi:hypothetical protein
MGCTGGSVAPYLQHGWGQSRASEIEAQPPGYWLALGFCRSNPADATACGPVRACGHITTGSLRRAARTAAHARGRGDGRPDCRVPQLQRGPVSVSVYVYVGHASLNWLYTPVRPAPHRPYGPSRDPAGRW